MLVVYDTETTGVKHEDRIVELASVVVIGDQPHYFVERCNPGIPIPAGASNVHGIYNSDLEDCRTDTEVVLDWFKYIADLAETSEHPVVMAGHNQAFDARMVKKYAPIPYDLSLCSLKLARQKHPEWDNHKLETCFNNLGCKGQHKAHSALDDVLMTLGIITAFCNNLGVGYLDIAAEQSKPMFVAVMPFGKHKGKKIEDVPRSYMSYMLGLPDLDKDIKHTFNTMLS